MRSHARGREQTTAPILVAMANRWLTAISTEPPCNQLTPSSAERARRERRHPKASTPEELLPLMMWTAPPRGHLSAERWSLERHQEGGRPCGNISELASTLPRIAFKSTRWRGRLFRHET